MNGRSFHCAKLACSYSIVTTRCPLHGMPDGRTSPYIPIPQLKAGRIDPTDARQICEADFRQWTRRTYWQTWDVVVSRRCNPGETAFVPPGFEFALGQNLVILRARAKCRLAGHLHADAEAVVEQVAVVVQRRDAREGHRVALLGGQGQTFHPQEVVPAADAEELVHFHVEADV